MLKVVVTHMNAKQKGCGTVAVSPRYALRIVRKFSVLWQLPAEKVQVSASGSNLKTTGSLENIAMTRNVSLKCHRRHS